jgi:hypothetical protein
LFSGVIRVLRKVLVKEKSMERREFFVREEEYREKAVCSWFFGFGAGFGCEFCGFWSS